MIDSLLIAQGTLNALEVLTRMAIAAAILLFLAGIFWWLSRSTLRFRRLIRVVAVSSGVLGIALVVFMVLGAKGCFTKVREYTITLDLAHPKGISAFTPGSCRKALIGETPSYDCIFEGQIDLTLTFTRSRSIHRRARLLWAVGDERAIQNIRIFTDPLSLDETVELSRYLIDQWQLPGEAFLEWEQKARSGIREELKQFRPSLDPEADSQIEYSIVPISDTFGSGSSWFLSIYFYWPKEDAP